MGKLWRAIFKRKRNLAIIAIMVLMPIMAPLADFAGVNPALVVTAYQAASGLVNLITPTSAVVMGGLAIARVGYGVWLKFVAVLLALLFVLTIIVLAGGVLLS